MQDTQRRPEAPGRRSVLLADAHAATRVGISRAIEPHGLRVVGEAGDAAAAAREAARLHPDVSVISGELPGDALEAIGLIAEAAPMTRIVVMADSPAPERMLAALRAGADGYLPQSIPAHRLGPVLRDFADGEAAVPRGLVASLIAELRRRGERGRPALTVAARRIELTEREHDVALRLRRRASTATIAADLGITEVTVRRHVSALLRRTGARDREALIELLAPEG
jgi:DNA-binding NarL/FixJ family response regulator